MSTLTRAIERLNNELLITSTPDSEFAKDMRTVLDALANPSYVYKATCLRVIDGDTQIYSVDLGFRISAAITIRLLHIDCPEHGTPDGEAATLFVTGLFARKPEITIQTQKDEQTFARYLADVWLDGVLLSNTLKNAGYAKPNSPWNKKVVL